MFCPICGALNEDTSKFCGICGASLMIEQPAGVPEVQAEPIPAAEPEPATPEEPVFENAAAEPVSDAVEAAPQLQTPPARPAVYQSVQQPPVRLSNEPVPGKGMGIAGMVLGIVSLVFCCSPILALICAVVAVILSAMSLHQAKQAGTGNVFAVVGIVCGGVGIAASLISFLLTIGLYIGMYSGMTGAQPDTYYYY